MATSTITCQVGDEHLLVDARNPRIPFLKGVFIYSFTLTESTDYDAADTVEIDFDGLQSILYADIKEYAGTSYSSIAYTDAAYSSGAGRKITTVATDLASDYLKVFVIGTV